MNLDQEKLNAIDLLVQGTSITQVAKDLDTHRSKIHRWLNNPQFQREMRNRLRHFAHAKLLLSIPHTEEAINVLVGIMRDVDIKPSDRISACDKILSLTKDALEESLAVELDELKASLSLAEG